jgi:hypothetical protein
MVGQENTIDRVSLMRSLTERGLNAIELDEQGQTQVAVTVMDDSGPGMVGEGMRPEITGYMEQASEEWQGSTRLYIVLEGKSYPARVGLRGQSGATGEPYRSENWEEVHSEAEAVEVFERLWRRRDDFFGSLSNRSE